ncbi:hypothetical protein [Helicobacter canis]|uniref:Uncharacterized protein n=1 Tax=Helicobacter canis NCTC 12740 TaxID=1357399 RepID=V8CLW9_9HELI|nr:hypothetical protein [Helicobacter canis]ETD27751.1 hypothetical protein HMPREF2087_00672 [Helicobacter canis NCTC 12740]
MKNLSKTLASLAILVAVGLVIFSCLPPQKSLQEKEPNMVDISHYEGILRTKSRA